MLTNKDQVVPNPTLIQDTGSHSDVLRVCVTLVTFSFVGGSFSVTCISPPGGVYQHAYLELTRFGEESHAHLPHRSGCHATSADVSSQHAPLWALTIPCGPPHPHTSRICLPSPPDKHTVSHHRFGAAYQAFPLTLACVQSLSLQRLARIALRSQLSPPPLLWHRGKTGYGHQSHIVITKCSQSDSGQSANHTPVCFISLTPLIPAILQNYTHVIFLAFNKGQSGVRGGIPVLASARLALFW